MSAMFAKQVTWWPYLLYIFIAREFRYLGLRKAATLKYLDQVNLILNMFQWPWFPSYNTFGSKLVWSEYLVHLNHILTPTFEHFDTIRRWSWVLFIGSDVQDHDVRDRAWNWGHENNCISMIQQQRGNGRALSPQTATFHIFMKCTIK